MPWQRSHQGDEQVAAGCVQQVLPGQKTLNGVRCRGIPDVGSSMTGTIAADVVAMFAQAGNIMRPSRYQLIDGDRATRSLSAKPFFSNQRTRKGTTMAIRLHDRFGMGFLGRVCPATRLVGRMDCAVSRFWDVANDPLIWRLVNAPRCRPLIFRSNPFRSSASDNGARQPCRFRPDGIKAACVIRLP